MGTRRSPRPRPVVFARVGWLEYYDSAKPDPTRPTGGGAFNLRRRGAEVDNFHPIRRRLYGYVKTGSRTSGLNLARLGAKGLDRVDDVLVIFVAVHPDVEGQRIVGWYDGATCLAEHGNRSDHEAGAYAIYNLVAPSHAAHLLDSRERESHDAIPKGKGALGQSNVFYAEYPQQRGKSGRWIDAAVEYVIGYKPPKRGARVAGPPLRDYKPVPERASTRQPLPFTKDPDLLDNALTSHRQLQHELARLARARGFPAHRPGRDWPEFDVGWFQGKRLTVVEVKSLVDANENHQLRYGIGQLLEYRTRVLQEGQQVRAVLAVSRRPKDPWLDICRAAGIVLVWPDTFHTLFPARLRKRR